MFRSFELGTEEFQSFCVKLVFMGFETLNELLPVMGMLPHPAFSGGGKGRVVQQQSVGRNMQNRCPNLHDQVAESQSVTQ